MNQVFGSVFVFITPPTYRNSAPGALAPLPFLSDSRGHFAARAQTARRGKVLTLLLLRTYDKDVMIISYNKANIKYKAVTCIIDEAN